MKPEFRNLRDKLREADQLQRQLSETLAQAERNCQHKYGPVVYDPVITEAYTIPGDAPGTMGVDWRGPCYVPRSEEPRWKRQCLECGVVEYTEDVKEKIEKLPAWPEDRRRQ